MKGVLTMKRFFALLTFGMVGLITISMGFIFHTAVLAQDEVCTYNKNNPTLKSARSSSISFKYECAKDELRDLICNSHIMLALVYFSWIEDANIRRDSVLKELRLAFEVNPEWSDALPFNPPPVGDFNKLISEAKTFTKKDASTITPEPAESRPPSPGKRGQWSMLGRVSYSHILNKVDSVYSNGYRLIINDGSKSVVGGSITFRYMLDPSISIGIGAGYEQFSDDYMIPIFCDLRGYILEENPRPYPFVDIGYSLSENGNGGFYFNTGLASELRISKKLILVFEVSYKMKQATTTTNWPYDETEGAYIEHKDGISYKHRQDLVAFSIGMRF